MLNRYPIKIYSHEYDDTVKINVYCTDKCNYKCSYCYNMKDRYERTETEVDLNKVYNFATWLKEKTNKNVDVILIGGEPTVHTQFESFIEKTIIDDINVISFTNFSKPIEFFKRTILKNAKYLATYHHTTEERKNQFFKKLLLLENNNLINNIEAVNVMLLKDKFEQCLNIYDTLYSRYGNKIRCNLLDDCDKEKITTLRLQNYSPEQLNEYNKRCSFSAHNKENIVIFNDSTSENYDDYEIKNNIDFNFKLWKCDAGKNYFHIDVNENIYPCSHMTTKKLATLDSYQTVKFKETICLTSLCPCEYGLGKQKIFSNKK